MRIKLPAVIGLLCLAFGGWAQLPEELPTIGLMGFWPFSGNARDVSGNGHQSKLNGPKLTTDRFGNVNEAYHFNGSSDFISTNYEGILGPHARAVSFWARSTESGKAMPAVAWGGYKAYPKAGSRFDCSFNYMKSGGATVDASDAALTFEAHSNIGDGEWHHYVYQFSTPLLKAVEVYQDGVQLTHEAYKFYPDTYLNTVSYFNVHFGTVICPGCNFFFSGDLDDIAIYNRTLSQSEIAALYGASNPNKFQKLVLRSLGILALLALIAWLIKLRVNSLLKKAYEKNRQHNQLYELENKALKAQMNPHFMFNSLNTIQLFIIVNENEKAQLYLSKFSRLIRKMLESNIKDSITLKEEIDLLERYLEIESMRFNAVFKYKTMIKGDLDPEAIQIPHFLIQPFVENAIWHGLLPKDGDKSLFIWFEIVDEKTLSCIVDDNGVGFTTASQPEELKDKKSLAVNFIRQRLQLMSKMKKRDYGITIENKTGEDGTSAGTRVSLLIPIIN